MKTFMIDFDVAATKSFLVKADSVEEAKKKAREALEGDSEVTHVLDTSAYIPSEAEKAAYDYTDLTEMGDTEHQVPDETEEVTEGRLPSEFQRIVEQRNIVEWLPFNCSLCSVPYGFHFLNLGVVFDSSCGCASSLPRPSSYREVAEFYNSHIEGSRKEFDEFWGFA